MHALKNVFEKFFEKQMDLYVTLMDLEKTFDRVDKDALWKVTRMHSVGGKQLEAEKIYQKCNASG